MSKHLIHFEGDEHGRLHLTVFASLEETMDYMSSHLSSGDEYATVYELNESELVPVLKYKAHMWGEDGHLRFLYDENGVTIRDEAGQHLFEWFEPKSLK